MPERIQLRRTKGWRLQEASMALNDLPAVKVDRSTWAGNPWRVVAVHDFWSVQNQRGNPEGGVFNTRADALDYCLNRFQEHVEENPAPLEELRGKNLACWCPLPEPGEPDNCHAATLLQLANPPQENP